MEHKSTFRNPEDGDFCRDMSGGTGRWPIGVITDGGGRTILTVRKPGPCSLTCTP
jgi:hypothetical protein